jgi:hypothetical protein
MVGFGHASAAVAEVVGVQIEKQAHAARIGNRHGITSCGVIWLAFIIRQDSLTAVLSALVVDASVT